MKSPYADWPNLLRVARELTKYEHPHKVADMLISMLKTDADLAQTMREAGEGRT